jgi:hypothetical protein
VAADVASVDAFRKAKPGPAKEIAEELDTYVKDLGVLLHIAEGYENELESEDSGGAAWANFEASRRPRW